MALALMLRTAPRLQGLSFIASQSQSAVAKCTPLASMRGFALLPNHNKVSSSNTNIKIMPQSRQMSGDHSKMWPIEKAVSVSLLFVVPATFAYPNFILDNLFAALTVVHFHWGLEACVVDYVRPIIVGNLIPKITMFWLYAISASTLGFLIYYNVSDIGIGATVRQYWAIKN